MKGISIFALILVGPYILGFIVSRKKLERLVFIIYFFIALLVTDFLKSAYNDPRPYMVDSGIRAKSSIPTTGCGNPSGHASMGVFMMLIIMEEFFIKRKLYVNQDCSKVAETIFSGNLV